ncbi:phosphatase PAP2 family protein [Roseimarinus sediminis]|uniref:phosphatase PAP2 family protein n=1 Tax=Roseimarinus sediminis TaxID=1610899 RepID=UPI003D1A369F
MYLVFVPMNSFRNILFIALSVVFFNLSACKKTSDTCQSEGTEKEFIVGLREVSYPLPVVDYIGNNNFNFEKSRSIDDNPIAYILRGINDIWKGTTDEYQSASSENGPGNEDREKGNPIVDSVVWARNIQYVIRATHNRTDEETVLAYLDENRSKYYSVIDGFGPLTEDYVKNSGAYVDLPKTTTDQILRNYHYKSVYNDDAVFAGSEESPLGAVVKLNKAFRDINSSSNPVKYLYSTPRPWRMNDYGAVIFKGTTYDTTTHSPTYSCIDYMGQETLEIFDIYESSVKIVPGLMCSRKNHQIIYDDEHPTLQDLYTNTTENRRTDNAYPSGHTNAGFLSSLAYAYAFPERFSELVYRGAQLGENRIVVGMHSPVDVIGGKIMALSMACAALNNPTVAKNAEEAVRVMKEFFGAKADSANLSLYDFAHSKEENPTGYILGDFVNPEVFNNNYYNDKAELKKIFRERMTYGFPQDSTKANQAPIVPKGAEAILKSRFPYLSDNQRRVVLYTTEIPSGYKILDKTNGWGRIDLLAAADGYGSIIGKVCVDMDASLGGFNALDTWGNDIDGEGLLIKKGSGKLILTGNNSYIGKTLIANGTLSTTSRSALGISDVKIEESGILEVIEPLEIKGGLYSKGGTISVHVSSTDTAQIMVGGKTKLENAILMINFDQNTELKTGDQFVIIKAKELIDNFKNITANKKEVTGKVLDNTLYVVVE